MAGRDSSGAKLQLMTTEEILASTRDGFWQADLEAGLTFASQRLLQMLGLASEGQGEVRSAEVLDLAWVHPEDRSRVQHDFEQLLQGAEELRHELRLRTSSGGWLWVQCRSRVVARNAGGRPIGLCGWVGDISRRRQLEQSLGALLEQRTAAPVEEYLQKAALQFADLIGMRYVHIGCLTDDKQHVETAVAVRDGSLVSNFRYALDGTPCTTVLGQSVCAYPSGVQALFPADRGLVSLGVESYLGVALRSRRSEVIGILVAMNDRPFEHDELPGAFITLVADRMARELELARTETALEQHMRRAHQMFEQTIGGIGLLREIKDSDGGIADLEWVEANPALAQHLGIDAAIRTGLSLNRSEGCCVEVILDMARVLGTSGVVERQIRCKKGRWYDVRVYRPEEGMVGLVTSDVTDRLRAEEATRESEHRLRGVLADLSQAAFVLDPHGSVAFANKAALDLVGASQEDVLGSNWLLRFVPDQERCRIEKLLEPAGGLQNCPPHLSSRVRRSDGTHRLVEWDVHPLEDAAGRTEAIAVVGRDVTDAEELQRRARVAQRMEAVGRLAGGVAHDFNNLLTVINGYVRLALPKAADGQLRAYLQEIERAGAKATELTRQLLALSRKQVMQVRDFDAHATIRSMEPLVARLLGRGVFLDLELEASNDWIHFDPNAVEQVLLTLAARAREVVPEGGAVKLSTACVMGPLGVQGGVLPANSYLRLRFEDDGPAMSDGAIAHLFEPFSDAGTGLRSGLELATVYGLLSQGGGGVNAESGDWGTRFDLYFLSAPPRVAQTPSLSGKTSASSGAVLLVEDQDQVRVFAADVLTGAGLEVVSISDPSSALSMLAQAGEEIGLLLTDVVMPGMSGRDLAVQARQIRPNLPVIFMSGYAEAGPSVTELEMLGARFLQKPFTPDQLEGAVRAELSKAEPARIVVADDDGGVRAFLGSVLEGAGYNVTLVEDGAAAIHALRSFPTDLLITDLVMPGQEGIETIRTVRQTWPDLRIVAISGAFYGQFLRTAEVLGAKAVLQKPIRPEDLLRAVRDVLKQ